METTARNFHLLADPIRLKILCLLKKQEMCVADLCKELDLSQPKVSYHLKILLDAELIERRVAGTWSYYRLCTDLEGWLKKECKELLKEATIN